MSDDITAGVDKLAINTDAKQAAFDVNWDAAVTDSWVDDNFDIDASVREADAWVSDSGSDDESDTYGRAPHKDTVPRVRRKSGKREPRPARAKPLQTTKQTQTPAPAGDLADIMRGIQAKLGDTRKEDTKRDTAKPRAVPPTSPAKSAKPHHNRHTETPTATHNNSNAKGFRYQPPAKPRGKPVADVSKETPASKAIPSIWSTEGTAATTKVNHAATREHYAAKKALWHRQQEEENQSNSKSKSKSRKEHTPAAHSHFAYSDDESPATAPATAPSTAPATTPATAEPLPSMWA